MAEVLVDRTESKHKAPGSWAAQGHGVELGNLAGVRPLVQGAHAGHVRLAAGRRWILENTGADRRLREGAEELGLGRYDQERWQSHRYSALERSTATSAEMRLSVFRAR